MHLRGGALFASNTILTTSTVPMAFKQRRQLFPEKLWELVNKPTSGIKWSPDGKRIEVERGQLEKFLHKSQQQQTKFRSHNFDSFIRQLHFYGFKKSGNSYHHDKFQQGQPESLPSMKRKYSMQVKHPHRRLQPAPRIESIRHHHTISRTIRPAKLEPLEEPVTNSVTPFNTPSPSPPSSSKQAQSTTTLTMYTLKPRKASNDLAFDNVREDEVCATKSDNSLSISIPVDYSNWPKTLVLDNYRFGNQNILSAYFIYGHNT